MKTLNSEIVNKIIDKQNQGKEIKRNERIWHQNITGVRKANLVYHYSKEELIEYAKCFNDPVYFIEKYCKIQTGEGIKDIKLYDFQKKTLEDWQKNRFVLVAQSRQVGISLLLSLFILHYATFNLDKASLFLDHKAANLLNSLEHIKFAYKNLPFFLKNGVIRYNKKNIVFDNGSKIVGMVITKTFGLGFGCDKIIINNFAKVPPSIKKNMYNAIVPTMSARENSQMIIASSFYGYDDFYELFSNAERGLNKWHAIKIGWWEVPGRDEKWKNEQIKILGEDIFDMEYDMKIKGKS